jgi:hypothetical protein
MHYQIGFGVESSSALLATKKTQAQAQAHVRNGSQA